jgi:transcriptional regulator with XRE-family HTH domain
MNKTLKFFRKMYDVTQAEIARKTGIDFTVISRIETGVLRGTDTQQEKIAKFFEVDKEIIFPLERKKDG